MAKITTVILRCGLNGCGDRVGQVKTNGTTTQVLRYQKIGEIPVLAPRYMPAGGDAKLLRQTDDGYVVPRRRQWPPVVSPLDAISFVMCPSRPSAIICRTVRVVTSQPLR